LAEELQWVLIIMMKFGHILLENSTNKNIEILNEGIMGYTSLDNLLDLEMRVTDFESDVYIIYLGQALNNQVFLMV